jgi:hypothetical protein
VISDVEVRDAGTEGRGVYALRSFSPGEFIFRRHTRIYTTAELDRANDWEHIHLCKWGTTVAAVGDRLRLVVASDLCTCSRRPH